MLRMFLVNQTFLPVGNNIISQYLKKADDRTVHGTKLWRDPHGQESKNTRVQV